MKLRSGKKIGSIYDTTIPPFRLILIPDKNKPMIDFDNASKEWRKNKTYLGNGMFKYTYPALPGPK